MKSSATECQNVGLIPQHTATTSVVLKDFTPLTNVALRQLWRLKNRHVGQQPGRTFPLVIMKDLPLKGGRT